MKSWDRAQIPKPHARVALVFGAPFVVPRETPERELADWSRRLEATLAACEQRCLDVIGRHHV
jgi:lysophospholipid acyltransferase (LPLAT)-like uncharacterized protein